MRDKALALRMLERMWLIRLFEERLIALFEEGRIKGTTHSCVGQEVCAAALAEHLTERDYVLSNHRGHGHFLAMGGDPAGLLAELVGQPDGVCAGRGGSQHLHQPNFFSNGITGGMTPVGTGIALALKDEAPGALCVVFLGDGAVSQGVVYESLNIAGLWDLPLLLAVEDNKYAMSTPVARGLAGRIEDRAAAFGIASHRLVCDDALALQGELATIVTTMRRTGRPAMVVFDTYRHQGHSKSDTRSYRTREEEAAWRARDPLEALHARLPATEAAAAKARAQTRIDQAVTARLGS